MRINPWIAKAERSMTNAGSSYHERIDGLPDVRALSQPSSR